ncbi:MAG: hypothetical protein ACSHYF_06245 [Verrucomicrobiaceae bacterium]
MIKAPYKTLRQAERNYPGILKTLRQIESQNTPTTSSGITGRTITLASLTTLFSITPPHQKKLTP